MGSMKRYLAFEGSEYYPEGGWDDFVGDYDSIEEALKAIKEKQVNYREGHLVWAHIVDLSTKEVTRIK